MKLTGTLRDETISQMVSAAEREMVRSGVHKDDRLRVCLSIEELLLDYRENLGADAAAVLQVNGKRANLKLTLEVSGPELDALSCPNSLILIKLLHGWKNAPVWEYHTGKNRILYEIITPASKYFFSNLKNMNLPE